MTITKFEYWILDLVVEARDSLKSLVLDDLEFLLNRPSHGLSRAELIDTLYRLFQRGDIAAALMEGSTPVEILIPSQSQIEATFDGEMNIFYGLTHQGGARWEAVSHPNWDQYVYVSEGIDDEGLLEGTEFLEGIIIASNRTLAEEVLALEQYRTRIATDTLSWDVITPWQATYWKTLPIGYQVRYRCTSIDVDEPAWVRERWREIMQWYTNPFKHQAA